MGDSPDRRTVSRALDQALTAWGNPRFDAWLADQQDAHDSGRGFGPRLQHRVADVTVTFEPGGAESDYGFGGEVVTRQEPARVEIVGEVVDADGRSCRYTITVELDRTYGHDDWLVDIATHLLAAAP